MKIPLFLIGWKTRLVLFSKNKFLILSLEVFGYSIVVMLFLLLLGYRISLLSFFGSLGAYLVYKEIISDIKRIVKR